MAFNAGSFAKSLSGIASGLSGGLSSGLRAARSYAGLTNTFSKLFGGGSTSTGSNAARSSSSSITRATGGAPTEWLNQYVNNVYSENGILKFLNKKIFQEFMPDISGYVLVFMVPPHLCGYEYGGSGNVNYNVYGDSYIGQVSSLVPVLSTAFSPPSVQLMTSSILSGNGNQIIPTKVAFGDSMSVTFIETIDLDIYSFHKTWIDYIGQVVEGSLGTADDYLFEEVNIIDYCGSFYFIKFKPNLEEIQYVGKAVNPTALK